MVFTDLDPISEFVLDLVMSPLFLCTLGDEGVVVDEGALVSFRARSPFMLHS